MELLGRHGCAFSAKHSYPSQVERAPAVIKRDRVSRPHPLDDTALSQARPDDGKMKLSRILSRIAAPP
jgi:hypothetical protein